MNGVNSGVFLHKLSGSLDGSKELEKVKILIKHGHEIDLKLS